MNKQEDRKKEIKEAWGLARSVREDTRLGELIGSIWNETCQDTFYLYKDAAEPGVYWYDTDSNRKLEKEFRDNARRRQESLWPEREDISRTY